jgi:hypothetical protein
MNGGPILSELGRMSHSIEGEVYLNIAILEEVMDAFKELATEDFDLDPPGMETWGDGVLSVTDVLQSIIDALLGIHAEEMVPDTIPDDF